MDRMFPDPMHTLTNLKERTPLFLQKMDAVNLNARNVKSLNEYFDWYYSNLMVFSCDEKQQIYNAVNVARGLCEARGNLIHLMNVPWRFAKCTNKLENGYPHTVGQIVVLPEHTLAMNRNQLVSLIVHEVSHVHQRTFTHFAEQQAESLGFERTGTWYDTNAHTRLRANPDTNDIVYSYGSLQCNPKYRNPYEPRLGDVVLVPYKGYPGYEHIRNPEHVFEIIAETNALHIEKLLRTAFS